MSRALKPTQVAAAVMEGGLNLSAPPLSLSPGEAIQLHNYEVNELGRYRRMLGFERYDGRARPSEQQYLSLVVADASSFSVTDIVTGGTSGATGEVVAIDLATNSLCLVEYTTGWVISETVGASTVAAEPSEGFAETDALDVTFKLATLEYYRALIGTVPGSGPIRGIVSYAGDVYCFRDNAGATACVMHKATSAGWTTVTTPALSAGGSYRFDVGNFTGAAGTFLLCGVDGMNPAFTFDGTTFTQLSTGISPDTPVTLAVLPSKILTLGFANGSLMISGIGTPGTFTDEIAVADEIRDLQVQPNQALAIFCRQPLQILYGTSPADFNLTTFSKDLGAETGTVATLSDSIFLTSSGITRLARVQDYGNFRDVPLSTRIKPLLDRYRGRVTASFAVREKNQYRLCFDDGTGVGLTFVAGEVAGAFTFDYGKVIRCAHSGVNSSGVEEVYFGSDDGYVYQVEKGYTFDGEAISAVCRPAFNFVVEPEFRKRFKKVTMEVDSPRRSALVILPELDYSGPDAPTGNLTHVDLNTVALGGGGYYDEAIWNEVFWSTAAVYLVEMYLSGVGRNISIVVFSNGLNEAPHTINSMLIHWSPRARRR